jgi:hypothetical protein
VFLGGVFQLTIESIEGRFPLRDDNSGMGTRYSPGTRSDRYGYVDDFLPTSDIRT